MKYESHNLVRDKRIDSDVNNLKYYRCELCGVIYYESLNGVMATSARSEKIRGLSCKDICVKDIIE